MGEGSHIRIALVNSGPQGDLFPLLTLSSNSRDNAVTAARLTPGPAQAPIVRHGFSRGDMNKHGSASDRPQRQTENTSTHV